MVIKFAFLSLFFVCFSCKIDSGASSIRRALISQLDSTHLSTFVIEHWYLNFNKANVDSFLESEEEEFYLVEYGNYSFPDYSFLIYKEGVENEYVYCSNDSLEKRIIVADSLDIESLIKPTKSIKEYFLSETGPVVVTQKRNDNTYYAQVYKYVGPSFGAVS